MMVMMTANTPSLKASMRPLVILPTPFFGLRVALEGGWSVRHAYRQLAYRGSPSLVWSTKATPVPEDRRARSGSSALSFESLKDLIAPLSRQFKARSYDTYMTPIVCAFCVGCNLANPAE